jgi:CheY-like chemotaxis protein
MSRPDERHPEAGAARMLRAALEPALAPDASAGALATARSAAQVVGLPGLDACLAGLAVRLGAPRSPMLLAMVGRLVGLAAAESLREFRAADAALASLAAELAGERWVLPASTETRESDGARGEDPAAAETPGVATLTVAEALDELSLAGDEAQRVARRTRLTVHVGAALRAALEWLTPESGRPRPFRLRAEDSLLEVVCESVESAGLLPAHEVLAAADGGLAPVSETTGRGSPEAWMVRVPAWSPRSMYLMIEQGALRLALPWHAVLRVSLVPAIELELREGRLATPVLAPLAPLAEGVAERPVVAITHGLKRALVVADRLVWRLAAEVCDPDEPAPVPELTRAVRSEEGDVFWIAEPRVLLHSVPMPHLAPAPRPKPAPAPAPAIPAPPAVSPPAIAPAAAPEAPAARSREIEEPIVLEAIDVEPLTAPLPSRPPAPRPTSAPAATAAPAPLPPSPSLPSLPSPPVPPAAAAPPSVAPGAEATPPAPTPSPTPPSVPPGAEATPPALTPAAVTPLTIEPAKGASVAPPPGVERPAESPTLPAWLDRFGSAPRHGQPEDRPGAGAPSAHPERAVLIAEDSIAAGRFLARMLEQLGFTPHVVETAGALRAALPAGRWSLVLADVELPDERGAEWLAALVAPLERAGVPLAALVRDDDDADAATRAGVRRWLRKPFDREELLHLLQATGRIARDA